MVQYRINVVSVAAVTIKVLEDNTIFFINNQTYTNLFLFFTRVEMSNANNINIGMHVRKVDMDSKKKQR